MQIVSSILPTIVELADPVSVDVGDLLAHWMGGELWIGAFRLCAVCFSAHDCIFDNRCCLLERTLWEDWAVGEGGQPWRYSASHDRD